MAFWPSVRALLATAVAISLLGCAGTRTSWQRARVRPGYEPPKRLQVVLLVETEAEDVERAVRELRQSLTYELELWGIAPVFGATRESMPLAELRVLEWKPGSRAKRWFGSRKARAHICVLVETTSLDGRTAFSGTVESTVVTAAGDLLSARRAGTAIARAIASGQVD